MHPPNKTKQQQNTTQPNTTQLKKKKTTNKHCTDLKQLICVMMSDEANTGFAIRNI